MVKNIVLAFQDKSVILELKLHGSDSKYEPNYFWRYLEDVILFFACSKKKTLCNDTSGSRKKSWFVFMKLCSECLGCLRRLFYIWYICPFNLHPEKLFEGYPVKSILFFLWNPAFSQDATLENLRCFCHPGKNRVDFTGYHSNHFPGCILNGQLSWNLLIMK